MAVASLTWVTVPLPAYVWVTDPVPTMVVA